jgi:Protein of unknown function (DUF1553)/Protein of unknown function (DUF1549)/Planctomycete cytochrome C
MHHFCPTLLAVALLTALAVPAHADGVKPKTDSDRKGLEFFEKKIRPVLVKQCYACHSQKAKDLQGGLLLDTRAGMRKGGETGPAVVPGDVKKSLIVDALRYDDLKMPPKKQLPKAVVDDFIKWIKLGAPDPRDGNAASKSTTTNDLAEARKFWAFQPPKVHQPPAVKNRGWPRSDIDRFILARLEQRGLSPVADADRRTLLRRVTFDLTGLPPTPKDIAAFLADDSKDAFAKVVDRLLASPQFGEHWGRHWLDVARYADSNGGDINLTFHDAWRYRDYVINAFNTDKPFNRFIVEQIAGDLLPAKSRAQRAEQLIATGLLLMGPKMLSERDKEKLRMDLVDEQLDTIGRAFLGLTIGCARCHDHKFDPIPQRDYYALAGILRSTKGVQGIRMNNVNVSGWIERPLPMPPERERALAAYNAKLDGLTKRIAALNRKLGKPVGGNRIVAAKDLPGIVVDDVAAKRVGQWKKSTFTKRYVGKGYVHDEKTGKGEKSISFTPDLPEAGLYEVRLSYTGGGGRAKNVPVTIRSADGEKTIFLDQTKQPRIGRLFHSLGRLRFAKGTGGSVTISNKGTSGFVIADAVQFLAADAGGVRHDPSTKQLAALERQLADLKKAAPQPAPMAMAVEDREQPTDWYICVRGEPHKHGRKVPRGFLSALRSHSRFAVNAKQSGRLELARWVADDNNPLTARVVANRAWHHLFGAGIVPSVDNFGKLGERPSHPDLLDRLAVEFAADGWSMKRLVRRIVLSRTYQLSSTHDARDAAADPQNRLLWRHNRRRLPAEAIRDAILSASGRLSLAAGNSSVIGLGEQAVANNLMDKTGELKGQPFRRSVYLPLIRNDLPDFLTVFDFADPDVVVGARAVTTVPAQALLMLNSSFVRGQAARLAERAFRDEPRDDERRLNHIYELTLGRLPTKAESARAFGYLDRLSSSGDRGKTVAAWASFCHALLASTEFRFLE